MMYELLAKQHVGLSISVFIWVKEPSLEEMVAIFEQSLDRDADGSVKSSVEATTL